MLIKFLVLRFLSNNLINFKILLYHKARWKIGNLLRLKHDRCWSFSSRCSHSPPTRKFVENGDRWIKEVRKESAFTYVYVSVPSLDSVISTIRASGKPRRLVLFDFTFGSAVSAIYVAPFSPRRVRAQQRFEDDGRRTRDFSVVNRDIVGNIKRSKRLLCVRKASYVRRPWLTSIHLREQGF